MFLVIKTSEEASYCYNAEIAKAKHSRKRCRSIEKESSLSVFCDVLPESKRIIAYYFLIRLNW